MYKYLFLLILISSLANAQSTYVPYNKDYYHLIERYEIKNGELFSRFHTTIKPITRKSIAAFADSLSIDSARLSAADEFNIQYLRDDNWEWSENSLETSKRPFLKRFYRTKTDFFHYSSEDFHVQVSPVLHFLGGKETASDVTNILNTRGLELRGMVNKKVGFYTLITENQMTPPLYVRQFIGDNFAVPGEGYFKGYKDHGVDFLHARGYITFNATKNIGFQFGHDKNFIGNGYRSLILSDFSPNQTFLKINTNVWRINYMNLFAELNAGRFFIGDHVYPKKYMALHHFSLNLTKNLNIGLFESVIIGRYDTLGSSRNIDLNYLNPIIFYRAIEQHVGSPDNVQLGFDYKWNFLRHFSLYGQIVLDEFYLQHLRDRDGWWANKFAIQNGLKYIDVAGIKNLDMQGEVNVIRPYTYAHFNQFTNYSHYNQPLAHPMGANLYELIGIIRYQPLPRLNLTAKTFYVKYGADTSGSNWGGNINLNYVTFEREFENTIGQGVATSLKFASFTASYQLRHNFFIDLTHVYRRTDSVLPELNTSTNFTSLALRLNLAQRNHEF